MSITHDGGVAAAVAIIEGTLSDDKSHYPAEMKRIELAAIDKGVSGLLLMEHAAMAVVETLCDLLGGTVTDRVLFVCGYGNNGGDGLAAARSFANMEVMRLMWLLPGNTTSFTEMNLKYARLLRK